MKEISLVVSRDLVQTLWDVGLVSILMILNIEKFKFTSYVEKFIPKPLLSFFLQIPPKAVIKFSGSACVRKENLDKNRFTECDVLLQARRYEKFKENTRKLTLTRIKMFLAFIQKEDYFYIYYPILKWIK